MLFGLRRKRPRETLDAVFDMEFFHDHAQPCALPRVQGRIERVGRTSMQRTIEPPDIDVARRING